MTKQHPSLPWNFVTHGFLDPSAFPDYHYTQNYYRTELYYFSINFGNSCSAITEPNCFWNCPVSVRTVSIGLPNPDRIVSVEFYSVIWVEELPNRNCFGINLVILLCVMVFLSSTLQGKNNLSEIHFINF